MYIYVFKLMINYYKIKKIYNKYHVIKCFVFVLSIFDVNIDLRLILLFMRFFSF
jgi:hypothetical protein